MTVEYTLQNTKGSSSEAEWGLGVPRMWRTKQVFACHHLAGQKKVRASGFVRIASHSFLHYGRKLQFLLLLSRFSTAKLSVDLYGLF